MQTKSIEVMIEALYKHIHHERWSESRAWRYIAIIDNRAAAYVDNLFVYVTISTINMEKKPRTNLVANEPE